METIGRFQIGTPPLCKGVNAGILRAARSYLEVHG